MREGGDRVPDRGSMSVGAGEPGFWFVRPFRALGTPSWVGVLLFAGISFGGFTFLDWLVAGSPDSVDTLVLLFHLVWFQFAAIVLGREMERILRYAESLGAGDSLRIRRILYDARWAALVALPVEIAYLVPVLLAPGFAPVDLFRHAALLSVFHILVGATAVWAFVWSMASLYSLGRAPLSLRPFTEDRALGLRPFGNGALRLVVLYELSLLAAATPIILASDYSMTGVPVFAVLGLVGFFLFFLPLRSFRRRMREAKARELDWIGPRYAELVKAVRDSGGSYVEPKVVESLSALDTIRKDVQQIHTWPFDVGIVTRLASITVLPLVISVIARELYILILHV